MPRLPTAEQLGQRPGISPRGGIAPLNLSTPDLRHEARAADELGRAVAGLGETFAVIAQREKVALDATRKTEAVTQYSNATFEMDQGEDGFSNVLSGDAVKRPLIEDYRKKREQLRKEIRDKLDNASQQTAFDQEASIVDRQFDGRLYRHIAEQSRVYNSATHQAALETEQRMAALNWQQPGQIELSILRTNYEINRKAQADGLDPAREADREVIETLKTIAESKIHDNVVNQMIIQGKDLAALSYYQKVKERLTPESIVTLGAKVNIASTDGEAIRAVDTALDLLGPKDFDDPVRLDLMDNFIRQQYKDNPRVIEQAIKDLRSRVVAHNDARQELIASNESKVLDAFRKGAGLKEIQSMPEYNAPGVDRSKLFDYINNSGYSAQQRARADREYIQGEKSRTGYRKYEELSDPRILGGLSNAQIQSLEPEIGWELTNRLIEKRGKLDQPGAIREAIVDTNLFNMVADEAGLEPFKSKPGEEEKAFLGRLRYEVESAIDVAQQAKHGDLSMEEKEKVTRKIIERKVIDTEGFDRELPAAAIRPEQRENIFVPIENVDQLWIKGAINYMRSVGAIPLSMTDDEAKRKMKGRLERGYAISITGGSSAEGKRILEGE